MYRYNPLLIVLVLVGAPTQQEPSYDGKPLSFWIQRLGDEDSDTSAQAVKAVSQIGSSAIPELTKLLRTGNRMSRAHALWVLKALGEEAAQAMPDIERLVVQKHNDPWVVSEAVRTLIAIVGDAKSELPRLTRLLLVPCPIEAQTELLGSLSTMSPDLKPAIDLLLSDELSGGLASDFRSVGEALMYLGPGADAFIPLLSARAADGAENNAVRTAAVEVLGFVESDIVVPIFIDLLDEADPRLAFSAAQSLTLTRRDPRAIPVLSRAIHWDNPPGTREAATVLLSMFGEAALPELRSALLTKSRPARLAAIRAIRSMGLGARDVAPDVLSLLHSADVKWERLECLQTLSSILPPEKLLPMLVRALKHDTPDVAEIAAIGLGQMGELAATAVPDLQRLLRDSRLVSVRVAAVASIGLIGSRDVDVFLSVVENTGRDIVSGSPQVRLAAENTLARLGSQNHTAVPILLKGLQNSEASVRVRAAWGLGFTGSAGRPAVPSLANALTDPDWSVQYTARASLRRLGDVAAQELRELDEQDAIPKSVLEEARKLTSPSRSPNAVSGLINALEAGDPSAAAKLGKMGADAVESVPALERALKWTGTRAVEVRVSAALALWQVQQQAEKPVAALLQVVTIYPNAPEAVRAFSSIGPPAVPHLREALTKPSRQVRYAALLAMAGMNHSDPGTAQGLIEIPGTRAILFLALHDPKPEVRQTAAFALLNLTPKPVSPE